ncbi:LuxR C-terminal-related transcriptional regulator [Bacillus siamensis]|uniref:response regulator transcription factor n=1 Tax=Bacillus siamensis TaxID=659243 RepID=UPI002E23A0DB|nr:LuxR C-terminal-related transcriptional regulator [Bacillus siamensis]MED5049247.1 LuxR C-terminal-related transcriptional regulator [Bacillus siamensis]MED5097500.1 LuxR C-terminal-related transcriptional regulator [Bacillus siamensis]
MKTDTEAEYYTALEIQIIRLIAKEKPNKEIARELNYSQRNIEYNISKLCRKMNVHTRVGIIAKAYKRDII